MLRPFAILLRCLLAASLMLGGAGVHAEASGAAMAPSSTPPCHESMDVETAMPSDAVAPDSVGHCGSDCRCACMALPMLMPVALMLPAPGVAIPEAPGTWLAWPSMSPLPTLRPPIA